MWENIRPGWLQCVKLSKTIHIYYDLWCSMAQCFLSPMVDNDTITPLIKLVDDDKGLQFLTFFPNTQWCAMIFQYFPTTRYQQKPCLPKIMFDSYISDHHLWWFSMLEPKNPKDIQRFSTAFQMFNDVSMIYLDSFIKYSGFLISVSSWFVEFSMVL
jgi:hypothetical protein